MAVINMSPSHFYSGVVKSSINFRILCDLMIVPVFQFIGEENTLVHYNIHRVHFQLKLAKLCVTSLFQINCKVALKIFSMPTVFP